MERAESLVRKKKEFNIDEQVQSQHGQSLLQVLLASRGRSDQPVLKRRGSFLGALVKERLAGRQPFSGSPRGVWAGHREGGQVQNSPLGDQYNRAVWRELFIFIFSSLGFLSPAFSKFPFFLSS